MYVATDRTRILYSNFRIPGAKFSSISRRKLRWENTSTKNVTRYRNNCIHLNSLHLIFIRNIILLKPRSFRCNLKINSSATLRGIPFTRSIARYTRSALLYHLRCFSSLLKLQRKMSRERRDFVSLRSERDTFINYFFSQKRTELICGRLRASIRMYVDEEFLEILRTHWREKKRIK